jgi:hypothetical protein
MERARVEACEVKYEVQLGVDAPATLPIRPRFSSSWLNKANETDTTQKNRERRLE